MIFRLAGAPPYEQAATPYALAVDEHFAAAAGHPAIAATRELVQQRGISYDAPVELAAYLDSELEPIRGLDPLPPGLDPRWRGVDFDTYLTDVRGFAAESDFEAFHDSQASYHSAVTDAYAEYLEDRPVVDWFEEALGPIDAARYRVVPGLLTGDFSFATTAELSDGSTDIAQIVYLESPDEEGVPVPTERTLDFVVHELAHGWVNPIFEKRAEEMRAYALPLFREVEETMRQQAYTSYPIMVNESVVRALVVIFLRERVGEESAQRSLAEQQQLGFAWTPELVAAIEAERESGTGSIDPEALVSATQEVFEGAR